MNRCPTGQRRIEGKCVYKNMYEDCKAVAKSFRQGVPLKPMIDELLDIYLLDKETAKERAEQRGIYKMKKVRWDDVYYVTLGAGDGW